MRGPNQRVLPKAHRDLRGPGESWAGTVSTAGGVIFFGDDDGHLVGVDARDGKHLWHFQMGEGLTASPITYAVDGKQYVAIASSTAIFSFGFIRARAVDAGAEGRDSGAAIALVCRSFAVRRRSQGSARSLASDHF